jgi:hypothetical protein
MSFIYNLRRDAAPMTEPFRKCKQCTIIKPIEQFRPYYNRKKAKANSRYLQCLTCESVNSAYKVAKARDDTDKMLKIEDTYRVCVNLGGVVPAAGAIAIGCDTKTEPALDVALATISDYAARAANKSTELDKTLDFTLWTFDEWLTHDFSVYDTHELFDIEDYLYDTLKEKLMPTECMESDLHIVRNVANEGIYNLIKARVEAARDVLNAAEEAAKAAGDGY